MPVFGISSSAQAKPFKSVQGFDSNNQTSTNIGAPAVATDAISLAYYQNVTNLTTGTLPAAVLPEYTGDVTKSAGSTTLTLSTTGVTAGTYKSVTVDAKGRISSGSNPTTLAGYGITDAQGSSDSLSAIAALAGTGGILKKTGVNTWTLDTATYLTANETINVSGDVTGSGTTALTLNLSTTGVTAGAYNTVTVDAKGRVTSGTNSVANKTAFNQLLGGAIPISGIEETGTLAFSVTGPGYLTVNLKTAGTAGTYTSVTTDTYGRVTAGTNPTTLAGYGITDAMALVAPGTSGNVLTSNGTSWVSQAPGAIDGGTF